nr:migration and invasion enhancer 1 isoform X1 [Chlorocebus sabaeus]
MGQRAPCQGGTPATGVSSNMACPSIYRHPYHGGCALAPQRHPGEPCGFEATYLELASAVKEQYPGIEIESRLGGTGAFEIEINGQLVFSKLENGGFPYEKDVSICSVGRTSGSSYPNSASSCHSTSLSSSSLRPSEEPVKENP